MAHKGREYEYFFRRDISHPVTSLLRIPKYWVWEDIEIEGSLAANFPPPPWYLEFSVSHTGDTNWVWRCFTTPTPPSGYSMAISHILTQDADFSITRWALSYPGLNLSTNIPGQQQDNDWPYMLLEMPTLQTDPTKIDVVDPGTLSPAHWGTFPV